MRRLWARHWPLLSVIGLYWGVLGRLILAMRARAEGNLIYPLDDAYIHMAIAKHTALAQVWGVTRYEFTSSTSSPLWTGLIALLYALFGVHELTPLIVNVLVGTLTIGVAYAILAHYIASRRLLSIALLAAVFAMPLPTLTLVGMEHVLHGLLSLGFLVLAAQTLAGGTLIKLNAGWRGVAAAAPPPASRLPLLLVLLAPLLAMTRYEGLFLIFITCVLLLLQRRIAFALILGGAALAPVILYGLWSLANGWFFLPNSILIKANVPGSPSPNTPSMLEKALRNLLTWHLLVIMASAVALLLSAFRHARPLRSAHRYANTLLIGTIILHATFASTGWFFRYEAYLVLAGVVIVAISMRDVVMPPVSLAAIWRSSLFHRLVVLLLLINTAPFLYRTIFPIYQTPIASQNIYEQQYQMGRFIRDHYAGERVLINDIGAVSYLADVQIIDIWGLGSLEPARLLLQGAWDTAAIIRIAQAQDASVAIVYEGLLDRYGGVPPAWLRLAEWQIADNVICASDRVAFYAPTAAAQDDLLRSLRQFRPQLPAGVQQVGAYVRQ